MRFAFKPLALDLRLNEEAPIVGGIYFEGFATHVLTSDLLLEITLKRRQGYLLACNRDCNTQGIGSLHRGSPPCTSEARAPCQGRAQEGRGQTCACDPRGWRSGR